MSESHRILDISADQALFSGAVQGFVITCFENERPPNGLAGLVDWRLHGAISYYLQEGAVTGKLGECTYFPFTRNGVTYHFVLVGAGESSQPGGRKQIPAEALRAA